MLRVIASHNAKGAKEYFAQSLSKEDYYSEGQEISGNWHGLAVGRLGLTGLVDTATFGALCDNKKPGTDERLTQRTRDNRTVGYDFNFHCPKSVSVVYEFTKDERILDAFKNAVNQTMREIETETKTRVRKNGANENRMTGNMAWVEFIHFTARPSIVTDKELLRQALRHGVGDVFVEEVKRELSRDDFVKENCNGCNWFSTQRGFGRRKIPH